MPSHCDLCGLPLRYGTITHTVDDKRLYFCCQGCDQAFKKNPEKYMKKLKEQGVALEPAPAGPAKK